MRRLDELHLDYLFAGARMLRALLLREGVAAGRRHVATLMMGIGAVYRRPNRHSDQAKFKESKPP